MNIEIVLENQRLMNGIVDSNVVKDKLIQLVKAVYSKINALNWVRFYPMREPITLVDDEILLCAKTRKILSLISDFGVEDRSYDIVEDIDKEILSDLQTNSEMAGCCRLEVFKEYFNDFCRFLKPEYVIINNKLHRRLLNEKLLPEFNDFAVHVNEHVEVF